MKKIKLLSLVITAMLMTGCALLSPEVKDEVLQQNAAFALGVKSSKVTISDKQKSGIKTNFTAKVGKKAYQCYVTNSFSVMGNVVSDAICSGTGKNFTNNGKTCDALSRAAGRC